MSAVFEINIIYNCEKSFFELLNLFNNSEFDYTVDSIEVIDDWEYNNCQKLNIYKIEEVLNLIVQGKILMINGNISHKYKFGIILNKYFEKRYNLNFWVSTKELIVLDNDYISSENSYLYSYITEKLINIINPNALICCAIGTELYIDDSVDIETIITNSKNVSEWIVSNLYDCHYLNNYKKIIVDNFEIYYLNSSNV